MFSSKDLFFTPAASGAYTVSKSLRFRSSASAYLNRTPGSAGNRKTWTWSGWVKRGKLSSGQMFFEAGNTSGTTNSDLLIFQFNSADNIRIDTGASVLRVTNAVFRDPSAWYHIVILMDTTQASNNSTRIFVNSVEQTYSTTNNIPQNTDTAVNNTVAHYLGRYDGSVNFFDGYMAEVNFIGGSALLPTDFGEYDTNGIWQPKAYTGSYSGTNSFYLKFTDVGATSGSNTGYGQDFSGNGNYWTTNNFGTTSTATTYDSMLDSPTNATGDIGNYCVANPLYKPSTQSSMSIRYANLDVGQAATNVNCSIASTLFMSSGKWYWEVTVGANFNFAGLGIQKDTATAWRGTGTVLYLSSGNKQIDGATATAYGATYTTNDVIGFAYDADAGTLTCYKNNVSQGTIYSSGAGSNWTPCGHDDNAGVGVTYYHSLNFGQRPFAYTPPSGYSALNTQNLSTPTITNGAQYMAAVTYTGTGSSQTITASSTNSGNNPNGTTFQPDFVWVKGRSGATDHALYDVVRGVQKQLESNTTTDETTETTGLTAFTSSGFTTGALAQMNTNTATYVAWQWKGGGTGVSNTSGSITSTVSANTSAGFSVVTYTGNGTAGATVGHGLGVAPSMIIVKGRNAAGTYWITYHQTIGNTTAVALNDTSASYTPSAAYWNNTSPDSSKFTVGNGSGVNTNTTTYVAYCFAPVAGYSAFGSYTGNGSTDGVFVYTGFRPRYLLLKITSGSGGSWQVKDTSRDTYNAATTTLYPNLSNAEASDTAVDILSNGFKLRASTGENASGATVIYAAFAENPFKISRAR